MYHLKRDPVTHGHFLSTVTGGAMLFKSKILPEFPTRDLWCFCMCVCHIQATMFSVLCFSVQGQVMQ